VSRHRGMKSRPIFLCRPGRLYLGMQEIKTRAYAEFLNGLDAKLAHINQVLEDLKSSAAGETKSTAGDKHETALAMLQIEQANAGKQKEELLLQKAVMEKIDPQIQTVAIVQGSLVKTQQHYFFISAALGKISVDNNTVFAISPQSPLGQKMMGRQKGEQFAFNNNNYFIEEIC
jgi:transcription elongation GreA/GreB family factor